MQLNKLNTTKENKKIVQFYQAVLTEVDVSLRQFSLK